MANGKAATDPEGAKKLGQASWGVCIAGVVVGIITIITIIAVNA